VQKPPWLSCAEVSASWEPYRCLAATSTQIVAIEPPLICPRRHAFHATHQAAVLSVSFFFQRAWPGCSTPPRTSSIHAGFFR